MTEDEIKQSGFNAFIHKPISRQKFDDLINKYR